MNSSHYCAGLDIGGTTVKSMLVDADGQPAGKMEEVRSHVKDGYHKTFGQLKESLKLLCGQMGVGLDTIAGVGLDVPAPCSKGVIWGQSNLSADWVGTNICEELSQEIGKPVWMTNDGNAAAFGEWLLRPQREDGLLFVAPGTGLGGGLVLPGGYLYEGANGLAMEIGDVSVPFLEDGILPKDGKGREGSLEAWVSLIAIRRQLEKKLAEDKHENHPLALEDSTIEEKAFQLRNYAEKGDSLALEIFQKQAHVLGYALGDQASELDPGLIVIGGGLAEAGFRDWYLEAVREGFNRRAATFYQHSPIPPHAPTTTFEWAIGGDSSAAYGVARKALELAKKP